MNIQDDFPPEDIRKLYDALQSLFLSVGTSAVLRQIGQSATKLVSAEISFIGLSSDFRECMHLVWPDSRWGYVEGHGAKIVYTLLREVIDTKQGFIIADANKEKRFASQGWFHQVTHGQQVEVSAITDAIRVDLPEARTMLVVPLVTSQGHLVGALYVDRTLSNECFSLDEQRLLEAFATQAANAIHNAEQYQQEKQTLFNSMYGLIPEYRTPLTAISMYTELMLQTEGSLTEQQKKYLKAIAEQTKKVRDIVDHMARTLQDR